MDFPEGFVPWLGFFVCVIKEPQGIDFNIVRSISEIKDNIEHKIWKTLQMAHKNFDGKLYYSYVRLCDIQSHVDNFIRGWPMKGKLHICINKCSIALFSTLITPEHCWFVDQSCFTKSLMVWTKTSFAGALADWGAGAGDPEGLRVPEGLEGQRVWECQMVCEGQMVWERQRVWEGQMVWECQRDWECQRVWEGQTVWECQGDWKCQKVWMCQMFCEG